ncbi:MAG: NrtA/SsuA/CpmA family ABC transporter substrate-binding protein [Syntrophobacteraceae bacterium]
MKIGKRARLVALPAVLIVFLAGCSQKAPEPVDKIRLGVETSVLSSPVWIAENKGYFQVEGLDVEIKEFGSGKMALRTMLEEGSLDMVTVAQTPITFTSFSRNDYAIVAIMTYSDKDVKVVGCKDHGIANVLDLKGKTIGVTIGSTGHSFLSVFLSNNGLALSDVRIVDMKATELAKGLAEGKIDAVSTWEPHILDARELLGTRAILFETKDIFREDWYLVANRDFMKNHPNAIERLLRAIERSEEFIRTNREVSIDIVAGRLKTARKFIDKCWDDFEFKLVLDESTIINLEDSARWAISNRLTDVAKVPNYLDFIYIDALKAVKPIAVTIPGK